MLLKPLALVAAAAAFVIVPELSEADESIFKALPVHPESFQLASELLGQSLAIPCAQCSGPDSRLNLDFTVQDGSKLLLNGFELYPHADPWHGDLVAQVVSSDGQAKEQRLGYSISVLPRAVDEEQQMELVDVVLRVIEVGRRFVDGIPAVRVSLVKAKTQEIIIANVELNQSGKVACHSMWCRTKIMVDDALKGVKGLAGCGKHKSMGHHRPGAHGAEHHKGPGHHHGKGPMHQGKTGHNWLHLLRNIASYIVLPVLMGITAGVAVAAGAMLLCSMVYRLTMLVRGARKQRARCLRKRRLTQQSIAAEEEKRSLMEAEEAQDSNLVPYKDDVAEN